MRQFKSRLFAIPALIVVALAITAASPVNAHVVLTEDLAVDGNNVGLTVCNGGVQEQSLAVMDDTPLNIVEAGAPQLLPGAVVNFATPANDADQVHVIFSAEARLLGQPLTYAVPTDFIQIIVLLDGVPMLPLNDLTFTTDTGHANATQACKRMPAVAMAVAHVVQVQYQIIDQAGMQNLTGTIDDWMLMVKISN